MLTNAGINSRRNHELQTSSSSPSPPTPSMAPYFIMILSAVCNSLSTFCIHFSAVRYALPPSCALLIRSFTSLILSFISLSISFSLSNSSLTSPSANPFGLSRHTQLLVCLRGLFGTVAVFCSFTALSTLPMGTASTIVYLSPALATILSRVLHVDGTRGRTPASTIMLTLTLAANFAGVSLVCQPSITSLHSNWTGVSYALCGALNLALVFVVQRRITLSPTAPVHYAHTIVAFALCSSTLSLYLGAADVLPLQQRAAVMLALVAGGFGFGGQAFLNVALKHIPVPVAAVIRSFNVPVSFALGFVVLDEAPPPSALVGVGVVMASVVAIAVINDANERKQRLLAKQNNGEQKIEQGWGERGEQQKKAIIVIGLDVDDGDGEDTDMAPLTSSSVTT